MLSMLYLIIKYHCIKKKEKKKRKNSFFAYEETKVWQYSLNICVFVEFNIYVNILQLHWLIALGLEKLYEIYHKGTHKVFKYCMKYLSQVNQMIICYF